MTLNGSAVPLLHDFLIESARRRPEHVALVCGDRRYDYATLDSQSDAFANALTSRGVARGDRVLIHGDNTLETAVAFWGTLKANAVVSIVNPQTRADKLAYLLADCRPAALVVDARSLRETAEPARKSRHLRAIFVTGPVSSAELDALPRALDWEHALAEHAGQPPPPRRALDVDLAGIVYTSGSSGDAKGVMLTHRNMLTAATSVSAYLGNREDDVLLGVLPMSFDYGLYQMIMAFGCGARLVLGRSFAYPAEVLRTIEQERVTGFPGVPTLFAMLNELDAWRELDLSSVRYVTNTAAALPVKHIHMLQRIFPQARLYSMYGLTECKRVSYLPPEDLQRKPTSVGIPIPNTELWVVDEHDNRLGPGEVGQLVVRGATVMRGYWEKPEETAKKLRPGPLPGEQVLYTGDYARLDEEGYLYFVGRMDDIIKSRGEKVAPKEVENALVAIAGVREAAVIGVPDEILGQAIHAFVVVEDGAELDERAILRECRQRLEGFMVPKHVAIVADLPKSANGKIAKRALVPLA